MTELGIYFSKMNKSFVFKTTCRWANDDNILFFGWTIPLSCCWYVCVCECLSDIILNVAHGLQWLSAACICCLCPLLPVQRGKMAQRRCDTSCSCVWQVWCYSLTQAASRPAASRQGAFVCVCIRQMGCVPCLCFIVLSSVNETHMGW